MNEPLMIIFAGNNGSGKSTIRNLIVDSLGISINIDPDALARKISSEHSEQYRISAGKEAIQLARDCIANMRSFSVETTLAGGNVIRLMRAAKAAGFTLMLFYVGLRDVRLNIERVASRVRNGGHYIATEDILRRQQTSLKNLLQNLNYIDQLIVIDNSESSGDVVLQVSHSIIAYQAEPLPSWVLPIQIEFIR